MIHCYEFYASPVISKPRYFELFFHFPWDFEIAGFNCTGQKLECDYDPRSYLFSSCVIEFIKVRREGLNDVTQKIFSHPKAIEL